MLENLLVRQCSPTLAGLKTGNLFPCGYRDRAEMRDALRAWNRRLAGKGLRVVPLRYRNGRALIYVYRPSKLCADLGQGAARELLAERGYPCASPARCLGVLARKLRESAEFPHEIGLFLGYPPEDVRGFIDHNAGDCKCVGCWKVYGDETRAKSLFTRYRKCTAVYCRRYAQGNTVEQLAVADGVHTKSI